MHEQLLKVVTPDDKIRKEIEKVTNAYKLVQNTFPSQITYIKEDLRRLQIARRFNTKQLIALEPLYASNIHNLYKVQSFLLRNTIG